MPRAKSEFQSIVAKVIHDPQLRSNFKLVTGNLSGGRDASFSDPEEFASLQAAGHAIRSRALSKLPELLEQLEQSCTHNDIQVHWAETALEANQIILDIMQHHNATRLIKGKSTVSEEVGINPFLEKHGIESTETDLGEFIIQLGHEKPAHIIAPAMHKNRAQVARLFHERLEGVPYTEKPEELTAIARRALREKFYNAHVGMSGVNMAVAETGTIVLVENEGNGRMCTSVPPVYIALMGIEKVVEKLDDVPPLLNLLTRSCTGQPISTYVTMISGPRPPEEKDGPREIHLVMLDNGRTRIYEDTELRQALLCIRCGACLNHCPVFIRTAGHAYGVYSGPIGTILMPQLLGLKEAGELVEASTLCGVCAEICPVKIPITDLILRLRRERNRTDGPSPVLGHDPRSGWLEKRIWKAWQWSNTSPSRYRRGTSWIRALTALAPKKITPVLKQWARTRTIPHIAKKSLHARVKEEGVDNE